MSIKAKQLPTFNELIEFLNRRCQMLEAVARRSLSMTTDYNFHQTNQGKLTALNAALTNVKCINYKGDHQIYQCGALKELSVPERLKRVQILRLCLNCLKGKHIVKDCLAGSCKICSKKHSTMLHEDREFTNNTNNNKKEKTNTSTGQIKLLTRYALTRIPKKR